MTIFLTILHVVVSLLLILVVLAQQGKGQDLASAFGGGGSSAAFGARGAATFMAKVTTICAVLFMLTSLGLSYFKGALSGGSVVPLTRLPRKPCRSTLVPGKHLLPESPANLKKAPCHPRARRSQQKDSPKAKRNSRLTRSKVPSPRTRAGRQKMPCLTSTWPDAG